MIQRLVAALMWVLVASLLILRRGRAERSITYAAITIAVAMTLNVDEVYVAADAVLGGTNMATLLSDVLLMIGLFFLGRGIMKAGIYRPAVVRIAVSRPALLVALAGLSVAFLLIRRGATTTTFMRRLGAQPAAATYSIIDFGYCGIVVAAMMILAVRQFRLGGGIDRIPASLLLVGSASGIALCTAVWIMDLAHVSGDLDLMISVGAAYGPLTLLTFVFLCAGLAGQPAIRNVGRRVRRRQTSRLVEQLEPVWRRATLVRPGLSQTNSLSTSMDDPETRLHREVVEIRDAMIDPRVTFEVGRIDRGALERAEKHLLGSDRSGPTADEGPVPRAGRRS